MLHRRSKIFLSSILPLIIVSILIPNLVLAQVRLSEIMYDIPGTDTDREWLEVENNSSLTVDLTTLTLFESNTNHKITALGEKNIPAGGFAVIASNSTKFKVDNPNFGGFLFDSSFSLSNSGETLAIKDKDQTIDSVSYKTDQAAGDGNTLSLVNGSWFSQPPTPGAANTSSSQSTASKGGESQSQSATSDNTSNSSGTNPATSWKVDPGIYPSAGPNRVAIVGAEITFKGSAVGVKNEPLSNANFFWNFGDGGTASGQSVAHAYKIPGEYIVTLDVSSGQYDAGSRAIVTVLPASISVSKVVSGNDGYIEIKNSSNKEIDISNFSLMVLGNTFKIPNNTFLAPSKVTVFVNEITKLNPSSVADVRILYPNGSVLNTNVVENISVNLDSGNKVVSNFQIKNNVSEVSAHNVIKVESNNKNNTSDKDVGSGAEGSAKSGSLWPWLLMLLSVVLISSGILVFVRTGKSDVEKLADQFDIVEE